MKQPETTNSLTSYAANCLRDQARATIEQLNGADASAFLQDLREEVVKALANEPDGRAVRPDIVDRANAVLFRRYGATAFKKAQDHFDYDGYSRLLWLGERIAEQSSAEAPLQVVEEFPLALAEKIGRRIEERFGISSNELASDGVLESIRVADGFIKVNRNPWQRMKLARELRIQFIRVARETEHDLDSFFDTIHSILRSLRQEMFVCKVEEHRPRLHGRILIVWLDRLIGAVTPEGIEVFEDELAFFIDALNTLLATSYTRPEKYITTEADLINQLREQGRGQFTGPSEGAFELLLALAMSTGLSLASETDMQGPGLLAGIVGRMQRSEAEKLEFVEQLAVTTLRAKPRITPFDILIEIRRNTEGDAAFLQQSEQCLAAYAELLASGAIAGLDHIEDVMSLLNEHPERTTA